MKHFVVLLAQVVGLAVAARPDTEQVITRFKTVAPLYRAVMDAEESQLGAIRTILTTQLVDFHLAVIASKESIVGNVIAREEYLLQQIGSQPGTVDGLCIGFVRTNIVMNVNLAGVYFTNCVNYADDALNIKVSEYYASLGTLEAKVTQLRLLDVFRGDNVFYTPQHIISKLNGKLASLESNPALTPAELEALANTVTRDLDTMLNTYNRCMSEAGVLLDRGLDLCVSQTVSICNATVAVPVCLSQSGITCNATVAVPGAQPMYLTPEKHIP